MSNKKKPNRHMLAFVTFLALVPLVYFIPNFVAQYILENRLLNIIISVGIIVPIISYGIIPLAIKLLHRE